MAFFVGASVAPLLNCFGIGLPAAFFFFLVLVGAAAFGAGAGFLLGGAGLGAGLRTGAAFLAPSFFKPLVGLSSTSTSGVFLLSSMLSLLW